MAFYPEQKEKGCTTKDKQIHITLERVQLRVQLPKEIVPGYTLIGGPRTDQVRKYFLLSHARFSNTLWHLMFSQIHFASFTPHTLSWPKVTPHLASNKMVNIALNCANIQLEKRRKGLRNGFTLFLKIGGKKFCGYIMCVCV